MKLCPHCQQEIQDEAIKCRWCQRLLVTIADGMPLASKINWQAKKPYLIAGGIILIVLILGLATSYDEFFGGPTDGAGSNGQLTSQPQVTLLPTTNEQGGAQSPAVLHAEVTDKNVIADKAQQLGIGSNNVRPSFDCNKAEMPDERAICNNKELSELDNLVAAGYQYLVKSRGKDYARKMALPLLRSRQSCNSDVACIQQKQMAAIAQYQAFGAPIQKNLGIVPGRCHMGGCFFSKIFAIHPIISTQNGILYNVESISEDVEATTLADGTPDYEHIKLPQFRGAPENSLVHCSTQKPFVAVQSNSNWHIFPINAGDPDDLFGFNMSDHAFYWAICMGEYVPADNLYTPEQIWKAKQLGYRRVWSGDENFPDFLTQEELLKYFGI